MNCRGGLQCIAMAYLQYRKQDQPDPYRDRDSGTAAHPFPFFQNDPPKIGDQDDERHMQGPGTRIVTQAALAHAVKKELEEQIIIIIITLS